MRVRTPLTARHTSPARHPARNVKRTATLNNASSSKKEHTQYHNVYGVPEPLPCRPPPLCLKDLECVRKLGIGAYGSVVLVRVRPRQESHQIDQPGALFAMKVLQKTDIRNFDKRYPDDTDAERESLCKLPWSPWVNGVVGVFHDTVNLYLKLECIPAGVLHDLIHHRGPLDANMARFYYANIVCALEFLHINGIVHRDLKPANILIKPDGYISLVDFGLAKLDTNAFTWAMVGTPIYMAPELFMGQPGIGRGVDWFSSGVILYEMMTKRVASVPFYGKDEGHIYLRIANKKFKWPRDIRVGKSLKSLVAGLLKHEALKRLGVAKSVKKQPWMSGIDWRQIEGQRYIAPWIPGDVHLTRTWQNRRLPPQAKVPDLVVVTPPEYLRYDRRAPRKRPENEPVDADEQEEFADRR